MNRVTDLDQFCLSQIMRPYQTMLGYEARLDRLPETLEQITARLSIDCEWSRCVLERTSAIGFTFPSYVKHPLVDLVNAARAAASNRKGANT